MLARKKVAAALLQQNLLDQLFVHKTTDSHTKTCQTTMQYDSNIKAAKHPELDSATVLVTTSLGLQRSRQ